jgi:hypothetical protein
MDFSASFSFPAFSLLARNTGETALDASNIGTKTSTRSRWRDLLFERIYQLEAYEHRLRYAIQTIMRDRIVNEGAFNNCFEMGDGDRIILTILRRGLKNRKLRIALEGSHVIDLNSWLIRYPEFVIRYQGDVSSEI